jgi:hypothetical protein
VRPIDQLYKEFADHLARMFGARDAAGLPYVMRRLLLKSRPAPRKPRRRRRPGREDAAPSLAPVASLGNGPAEAPRESGT